MRDISGYATLTMPFGTMKEADTFTCYHCNGVVHVKPRERDFTRCGICDHLICQPCRGKGCTPFEKKLEAHEASVLLYQRVKNGG